MLVQVKAKYLIETIHYDELKVYVNYKIKGIHKRYVRKSSLICTRRAGESMNTFYKRIVELLTDKEARIKELKDMITKDIEENSTEKLARQLAREGFSFEFQIKSSDL